MTDPVNKVALVGVGKIARDQHIPAIAADPAFQLAASASRNATINGVDSYNNLASLLAARADIPCISLCTPPQARYDDARRALLAGRHVMLEKPPGATLSEVQALADLALAQGVTLFATWHSRFACQVAPAKAWLADKTITKLQIIWKEDVRRWHPGQEWIWQAGGLGVFDPGINALSILTEVFPRPLHLTAASLSFPANRATPIAADLVFADTEGAAVTAAFDWRQRGPQSWDIHIETAQGNARLTDGGATFTIDGPAVNFSDTGPDREYPALYAHFAHLIATKTSEVDVAPLRHVADAFLLGQRLTVDAFDW